jgi:hypothetical protein
MKLKYDSVLFFKIKIRRFSTFWSRVCYKYSLDFGFGALDITCVKSITLAEVSEGVEGVGFLEEVAVLLVDDFTSALGLAKVLLLVDEVFSFKITWRFFFALLSLELPF